MNKLTKYKMNKLSKTHKIIISFILIILTIGIGYSALVSNLSISGNLLVKKYEDPNLFNKIVNMSSTETCITKYTGDVTDQVDQTVTASNVYFNKCADKRNIIFNNMCWQMIRTTETGGTKIIYNGEPVNGKCESTRSNHKGILGIQSSSQTLNASYLYGSSFTYDITNNTFTLTDTTTATWSDSTYEDLIGKFTCKNTTGTCTTLYNVNGYKNNTTAYTSSYTIDDTNYAQIGRSAFNANYRSPAMVGYMFNNVYNYAGSSAPTNGSLMGNDVSYSNGTYTLLPANGESTLGTTLDSTHHYTCNNGTGTCNKVRYYYDNNYYYIELDGEANIEEAVNNMLYNDNVNRYNSSIKGIIDAWYSQNLSSKTNKLEDAIYCNARNMGNQVANGWDKDGSLSEPLYFKIHSSDTLSCPNWTDQFNMNNNKARLTYPVGLATNEELSYLTVNDLSEHIRDLTNTNASWWGLSPFFFESIDANILIVDSYGAVNTIYYRSDYVSGVRPVVSLKSDARISSGDGSETSPWIIQE